MDLFELKTVVGSKLDSVIDELSELTLKCSDSETFQRTATALAVTVQARAVIKRFREPNVENCTRPIKKEY
ncbi:hypothetical protein [Ruminococcus sp.]|uniref:hypothetical protein n=1 Tax=Ruminococcus sp. TaxID=41978 RepID=UPI003F0EC372